VLDRFDGGHWVFVRDPDGNMVEIAEPMRKH
jgi:catechol 2,3-dioxygenase-like lactoylglutathione lyase family enzyme